MLKDGLWCVCWNWNRFTYLDCISLIQTSLFGQLAIEWFSNDYANAILFAVLLISSGCHYFLKLYCDSKFYWYFPSYLMQAIVSFITMQFQLCSVFFTFSLGTRSHYFGRTILHGGARVCHFSIYRLSLLDKGREEDLLSTLSFIDTFIKT